MPDAKSGWIAGVPDSATPIGDDFVLPPSGPGPVTFDRVHPFIDNRLAKKLGKSSTNRVADLSNPILLPWVREELRKLNERALTELQLWTPKERCWPIGVAGSLLYAVRPVGLLQQPNRVVLMWEEDHMVRHICLTDKQPPDVKPWWFGEPIGHYENRDTLGRRYRRPEHTDPGGRQTPHTDQLHEVERYRIVDNGEAIEVVVSAEDPGVLTTPRTALQRYRRNTDAPLGKEICAENNGDPFNHNIIPIPTADRPDF
jgi:hypothetical protein